MEIVQELQTREKTAAKAAAAFGFNQPNPEDIIHREDYASDAEYAVALARMTQTMATPEYRAAARKVGVVAHQQNEEAERKRQREEFERIRKEITLDELDQQNVDAEAQRLAKIELAQGKIMASEYGDAILRHAEKLTEKAKDRKAENMMFNAMIRKQYRTEE